VVEQEKSIEATGRLKKNLDFLESLKRRIKELENDNDMLANENEELR
jgi:hypothetical protein